LAVRRGEPGEAVRYPRAGGAPPATGPGRRPRRDPRLARVQKSLAATPRRVRPAPGAHATIVVSAAPAMSTEPHPRQYRRSILATATGATATWWGLGLPYSLFAWLLDIQQVKWVLICYAWEVPVAGALGPLLFPLLWFRNIERRWDETFRPEGVDPVRAAALERAILDFPIRVAGVFLLTSLIGY